MTKKFYSIEYLSVDLGVELACANRQYTSVVTCYMPPSDAIYIYKTSTDHNII